MRSKEYACIIVAAYNKHAATKLQELYNNCLYESLSLSMPTNDGTLIISKNEPQKHSNTYYVAVIS